MTFSGKLFIRKALPEDEGTIYQMICDLEDMEIDRAGFDMAFRKNIAAKNITYFIAELDKKPVGMVSCHIQPLLHHAALVSEIQEMYVAPQFRSKRIGNQLITHVVAHAKSEGAIQIEVTSRATRENAHRFYRKEGFDKSHVKLVRYFDKEN